MSSRLLVKSLPKHCTEARLRSHLSSHAHLITDVRILYTKQGTSRQFGFVGLKNAEAAAEVARAYSRSFIDTTRIQLEEARPVMARRRSKRMSAWENDEATRKRPRVEGREGSQEGMREQEDGVEEEGEEDDEEYQDLQGRAAATIAEEGGGASGDGEMDDLAYMRSKMSSAKWEEEEEEDGEEAEGEEGEEGEGEGGGGEWNMEEEVVNYTSGAEAERGGGGEAEDEGGEMREADEELAEHGRLFLRNLPFDTSEESLTALFRPFGPLSEVHLSIDNNSGRGKGTGYVQAPFHHARSTCHPRLDACPNPLSFLFFFEGRILHILPAHQKGKPAHLTPQKEGGLRGFKQGKEARLKETAGSSHNWNSLFMRADAVGDAVASSLDVDKRDLLLTEGGASAAVRLAQGESRVIRETREWLAERGVSLEALQKLAAGGPSVSSATSRSKTLLLEVRSLFGKYGQLRHVLLAPANTLALVEFLEVGDAKRAFRGLAYHKFHGAPLFLEWAPTGLLSEEPADADADKEKSIAAGEEGEEEGAEEAEGCTLFVKNLNFQTDSAALRAHFDRHFRVRSATVVTKPHPKKPSERVPMGYGFVEFHQASEAREALRRLARSRLDDHTLELKLSSRPSHASHPKESAAAGREGERKPTSTLIIRNLPFEASKRELKELFGAFGQLKQVRLPKKVEGSHRGFAFVEFGSKGEAVKAMSMLQSTHFYGRHLVLEYAKAEVSVEALRDKMRAQLAADAAAAGKEKRKGSKDVVDDIIL
ncbi:MAG: hypothetical protein SGPRY_004375 [Prymnesium sp.]